jgi:uncharacterized protein YciI
MSDDDNPKAVPKGAVLEASAAMLQKQLYAIFTEPTNGLGPVFANIEAHLEFQVQIEREGIMFAAGPMWTDDEQDWEGDGLVIVRAASRAEAIKVAERDPMHTSGARTFRVRPWLINEGTITVRLDYSTQKFSIS